MIVRAGAPDERAAAALAVATLQGPLSYLYPAAQTGQRPFILRSFDWDAEDRSVLLWKSTAATYCAFMDVRSLADGSAHIAYLGVLPQVRGQGIGSYMLRHVLELTHASVSIDAVSSNLGALALYEALGFVRTSEYPIHIRPLERDTTRHPQFRPAGPTLEAAVAEQGCGHTEILSPTGRRLWVGAIGAETINVRDPDLFQQRGVDAIAAHLLPTAKRLVFRDTESSLSLPAQSLTSVRLTRPGTIAARR